MSLTFVILIALAADPLVNWLRRKGLGRGAVLAIAVLAVYAALELLALLFIYTGAQFLKQLPTYIEQAEQLVAQLQASLQSMGLESAGSEAIASQIDLSKLLSWVADLLASLGSIIGNVITMILLTTFLFVDVVLWPGRLAETARRGHGYARRLMEFTLVLAIFYVAINGFVLNVIEPRLVVTRLNLTPFMNVASATFWPLVLGPAGAIVGVPLTMAFRSLVLDADPATRWLADLTGSKLPDLQPTAEPPASEQPDAVEKTPLG